MTSSVEAAELRDRFRGALLGGLLGDSFGSVLEGISPGDDRLNDLLERRVSRRVPWRHTDDTELTLGVARSLLAVGRVDPGHLLSTWTAAYEPARGYGRGTKLALRAAQRGEKPGTAAWEDGSRGSGAAARVTAIALLLHDRPGELSAAARASAAITHASAVAMDGCALHARAIAQALTLPRGARPDPREYLARLGPAGALGEKLPRLLPLLDAPPATLVAQLGNGLTADESIPLALQAFLRWSPSFEEVVINTARCGGDVDTIAAMSGTLAGAVIGASQLPASWLARAEGLIAARELADGLFELWQQRQAGGGMAG